MLVVDEPTIGLDAVTKLAVRDFIKLINKKWGTSIILTTHDMNDIDALTNKIILIGRGQILYNGNFSEIKERYGHIKEIEVEFAQDYEKIELDGYSVISHNKNMATLRNNEDKPFHVKDFFNEITNKYAVVDFQVSSISVDEILANLYTELKL